MSKRISDDFIGLISGETVKIIVGCKRKQFTVHEALIQTVPWFSQRISKDPISSRNRIFLDPNNNEPLTVQMVELLIAWLYRVTLPCISQDDEDEAKLRVKVYVALYLKAGTKHWNMPDLQNTIMDKLRARKTCSIGWFPPKLINRVYAEGDHGDALGMFIADSFVFKSQYWSYEQCEEAFTDQVEAGHHGFLTDCYWKLLNRKGPLHDPGRKAVCLYHKHDNGAKCKGG